LAHQSTAIHFWSIVDVTIWSCALVGEDDFIGLIFNVCFGVGGSNMTPALINAIRDLRTQARYKQPTYRAKD
jgi:hypothetical protein